MLGASLGAASLVNWNDEPGRTQADAVAAFDAAIASAAEQLESQNPAIPAGGTQGVPAV